MDYFFSVKRSTRTLKKDGILFLTRRLLPPPLRLAPQWKAINKDEKLWLIAWAHPGFILFKTEFAEKEILFSKEGLPNTPLHILQPGEQDFTLLWPQLWVRETGRVFKRHFTAVWGIPHTLRDEGKVELKCKKKPARLLDLQFKDSFMVERGWIIISCFNPKNIVCDKNQTTGPQGLFSLRQATVIWDFAKPI